MQLEKIGDARFLVVLPFCKKDHDLAIKLMRFIVRLSHPSHPTDADILLTYDTSTPQSSVREIRDEAAKYFKRVREMSYRDPMTTAWPQAPNEAFRRAAIFISAVYNCPWLWLEPDTTPLRPDWLSNIINEYEAAKKPFMGHIVNGMGHMNGVAVYPPKVENYSLEPFTASNAAFDVAMAKDIVGNHVHKANHLFQHMWTADPDEVMKQWSHAGLVSFPTWQSVDGRVNFKCAVMHRCKDGTLIDRITERNWGGKTQTEINVPDHTGAAQRQLEIKSFQNPESSHRTPLVEILIVTYQKDFPWLGYCLRAIDKFSSGFQGVTVAVPEGQEKEIAQLCEATGAKVCTMNEEPGKGMLEHMIAICSGELYVPRQTTHVMHVDSDCIYRMPFSPGDYFTDGKPHWVVRSYESMFEPGIKPRDYKGATWLGEVRELLKLDKDESRLSDCLQWLPVVKRTLGFTPVYYSMCRHPTIFPTRLYPKFRKFVEMVQQRSFRDYVLSCKNSFPQTFAEFPSLGAWAARFYPEEFFWIDISNVSKYGIPLAPIDRQKCYWSHGGISQEVPGGKTAKDEMESFLSAPYKKPRTFNPVQRKARHGKKKHLQ